MPEAAALVAGVCSPRFWSMQPLFVDYSALVAGVCSPHCWMLQPSVREAADLCTQVRFERAELAGMMAAGEMRALPPGEQLSALWPPRHVGSGRLLRVVS